MASTVRRGKPKIKPPSRNTLSFSPEKTWAQLSKNIREIQKQNASNLSFEENYRFAYNMVLHREGKQLYEGTKKLIIENLDQLANERIIPVFPSRASPDAMQQIQEEDIFLNALKGVWDDHISNMTRLSQILKYMDRVLPKTEGVPEIMDTGLQLFLKHIIRPPIEEHIINAILNQIKFERDGYSIIRSSVKGAVDVLLSLEVDTTSTKVYKRDFEPAFLYASENFYEQEGTKLIESCDAPDFLRKVETRFKEEDARVHHYLHTETSVPLTKILQDHLLTPHLSTVISLPGSGIDVMIDTGKVDDLSRLYRLFNSVPTGLPILRKSLKASIASRGTDINRTSLGEAAAAEAADAMNEETEAGKAKAKAKPKPVAGGAAQKLALALKWVEDVLNLRDQFDTLWKTAFKNDLSVESALNEAFESFINANERAPEFISLFIDENLKKGLKGKTDSEVDAVLDKTITVFRFLTDKDVFERYYKNHLAKRLLHGRSVSDDAERGMLAKLKVECGYQFTQKLEGMFNDMKISNDTMQAYRNHLAHVTSPSIDLAVTVMTSTFWPMTQQAASCVMPPEMVKTCKAFEQFYLSRHSGRRLTWQPSLGNADVKVAFKGKKIELNVSTFALVILLQFEDEEEGGFLTYQELKDQTAIEEAELQRNLQSLACAKFKVLKKHPPGRDINPDDSFSFNADFTAPLSKIKISTVASKVESGEERRETKDRIDEERRHQIEACIVRIMKDRKHMTHTDLVNEVIRQLTSRFQPDPLDIKKRVEGLIEREYLERCPDRKSYNYLA